MHKKLHSCFGYQRNLSIRYASKYYCCCCCRCCCCCCWWWIKRYSFVFAFLFVPRVHSVLLFTMISKKHSEQPKVASKQFFNLKLWFYFILKILLTIMQKFKPFVTSNPRLLRFNLDLKQNIIANWTWMVSRLKRSWAILGEPRELNN